MTKNNPNRAAQILGHAQELFILGGYEETSIADIVSAAGVTKGAFYHHFSSKAEVLETLLDQLVSHLEARLGGTFDAPEETPLDRYLAFLSILRSEFEFPSQDGSSTIGRGIYLDENDTIRNKLFQRIKDVTLPVLTEILREGVTGLPRPGEEARAISELVIQIAFAHQAALKRLRYAANPEETDQLVNQVAQLLKQQGIAIDRLIGVPDGTSIIRSDEAIEKLPMLGFQVT
jgi:AcrR family transcriptional regulator